MTQTPIFIVGHPRSGTTLLRELLQSHPRLSFPPESHFIPKFYRQFGDPQTEKEAILLAKRMLNLAWVQRWQLSISPETLAPCRSFREIVNMLFQDWASIHSKPRWGDKTPQYVTELPTLQTIFPDGKFIHIYRDGRDVALSWLRHPLGSENIYAAIESWKRSVEIGRHDGAHLPNESYLEIQYESLLDDPPKHLKQICEFINEEYSDDLLKPTRLDASLPLAAPRKKYVKESLKSPERIASNNSDKWMKEMSVVEQQRSEYLAGELLNQLNYRTMGERRTVPTWQQVMWKIHDAFHRYFRHIKRIHHYRWVHTHINLKWMELRQSISNRLRSR